MGLQDVFFKLRAAVRLAPRPRSCRTQISEHIYFHALWASTELAEANGPHEAYDEHPGRAGQAAVRPLAA